MGHNPHILGEIDFLASGRHVSPPPPPPSVAPAALVIDEHIGCHYVLYRIVKNEGIERRAEQSAGYLSVCSIGRACPLNTCLQECL